MDVSRIWHSLATRGDVLVEPLLCSCTVGHITVCDNRRDIDISHHRDVLNSSRIREEKQFSSLCTANYANLFMSFPTLVWCRKQVFPWIGILIYSWECDTGISSGDVICRRLKMLKRELDVFTTQMIEVRQQSSCTAMNAAVSVSGLAGAVRTMGQSVSKPRPEDMRVGKPEPYAPGKDFDDWDFTFNGYVGTLDPAYPALLKTARQWTTVMMTTPPQQSVTLLYLLTILTQKEARKVERNARNYAFETCRQLWCTERPIKKAARHYSYQSYLQLWSQKLKTCNTVKTNFLDLVRLYDEGNGADPCPDEVKKRALFRTRLSLWKHIFSWMLENWETSAHHFTRSDWRLLRGDRRTRWWSNGSRSCLPKKEKVKRNPARKVIRKGKKSSEANATGETTTEHSRFDGECRNCGEYGHEASDCSYKQTNKSQGKDNGTGKSKSKVI